MSEKKIKIRSIVSLHLVKKENNSKPQLSECSIDLIEPEGLTGYRDEEESLNKFGVKALSQVLVQGLNANIQGAHQNGIMDSAEHLRYVISELERAFVNVTEVIE